MKPIAALSAFTLAAAAAETPEPPLRDLLRDGLYAEEVANDPAAATRHYEQILARFEEQRPMAANALFRLAELYRKTGRNDDAIALYQRVLAQFPDATPQAALARTRLGTLGVQAVATPASPSPAATPAAEPVEDEETKEIRRLTELAKTSPDLLKPTREINRIAEKGWIRATRLLADRLEGEERQGMLNQALQSAAQGGQLALCEALLDQGADPNQPADGQTLAKAVWENRGEVVKLLLKKGTKPNLMPASCREWDDRNRNNYQQVGSALHVAAALGNEQMIRLLLDAGADAALPASKTGATPLRLFLESNSKNSLATVKLLLAKGAKGDAPAALGAKLPGTALYQAVSECSPEIVRCLLAAGAKPTDPGYLIAAAVSVEKTRLLLDFGADPKAAPAGDQSLLEAASITGGSAEAFWMLFDRGAPIDERWKAAGFPTGNVALRKALLERVLFPEWSTQDKIRLVALDPDAGSQAGDSPQPAQKFPVLAEKQLGPSVRSLAELLLDPPQDDYETRFRREWVTSASECVLYRKNASGGFEQILIRFDDAKPFPQPQWGDVIWFDTSRSPLSSRRKNAPWLKNAPWPDQTAWNLRSHAFLNIEVELDGRKQPLTLRGDRFSYDPTQPVFPWSPSLGARELVSTLGWNPGGGKRSFLVHRQGWPQPIELSLESNEAGTFKLREGDRLVLPPATPSQETTRARYGEVRLVSPGLWFGKRIPVTSETTAPTLLQVLAIAYQSDKNLTPFVSPLNPSEISRALGLVPEPSPQPQSPQISGSQNSFAPVPSILPHPDLAHLCIRRLNEDGTETTIAVNLQQAAAACRESTSREEARKFDVELQAGDIVELPMIESQKGKPWPGFSDAETRLFGLALSCRVQFTDGSSRELRDVQFAPPKIIETPHGRLSVPQGEGFTSLEASGLLDERSSYQARNTISLTRNGEETEKRLDAILLRDGDQIDMVLRRHPRPRVEPPAQPSPAAAPQPPGRRPVIPPPQQ